jgi:hypothetical protein
VLRGDALAREERDFQYEKIDVMASDAAWGEIVRLSGQDLSPVLEVDGKALAEFGLDQLERF